eukprot:CAMPEP_0115314092 /NCGR_PEP_ID=MMETSP0270-20121206/76842_1 /TAXON_ID=71861 /ORGANISM="Scrippsiella trochoidea, Strain CCMP3099" /LENGTH=63 /DNA_ID=CAMNT_0002733283 /DNA_START=42 /DNA_END=230 /DNA_ORIENTATION=-
MIESCFTFKGSRWPPSASKVLPAADPVPPSSSPTAVDAPGEASNVAPVLCPGAVLSPGDVPRR